MPCVIIVNISDMILYLSTNEEDVRAGHVMCSQNVKDFFRYLEIISLIIYLKVEKSQGQAQFRHNIELV